MCFPNASWSFDRGFFEQFLNFFKKVENRSKNQGTGLLGSVEGGSLPY